MRRRKSYGKLAEQMNLLSMGALLKYNASDGNVAIQKGVRETDMRAFEG